MEDTIKEIEVPSFVNDRYNAYKKEQKRIERLRIYKKALKLMALGATFAAVTVNSPKIAKNLHDLAVSAVERDNRLFNEEQTINNEKVEEITGRSIEEITEAGKSK